MAINYTELSERALLEGVVKHVFLHLQTSQELHYEEIYLTFLTSNVKMSDKLRKIYPEKMSILLCNNFQNLSVTKETLELDMTLVTGLERLSIPFHQIIQYIDKTNSFALEFKLPYKTNSSHAASSNTHEKVLKVDFNKED